jgi:hypothetical protein
MTASLHAVELPHPAVRRAASWRGSGPAAELVKAQAKFRVMRAAPASGGGGSGGHVLGPDPMDEDRSRADNLRELHFSQVMHHLTFAHRPAMDPFFEFLFLENR